MLYTSPKLAVHLFSLIIDFGFKAKLDKDPKSGSRLKASQKLLPIKRAGRVRVTYLKITLFSEFLNTFLKHILNIVLQLNNHI